ncbi:unnamed protein product [Arctogadus glacialis]
MMKSSSTRRPFSILLRSLSHIEWRGRRPGDSKCDLLNTLECKRCPSRFKGWVVALDRAWTGRVTQVRAAEASAPRPRLYWAVGGQLLADTLGTGRPRPPALRGSEAGTVEDVQLVPVNRERLNLF